jgi:hypothetical protein
MQDKFTIGPVTLVQLVGLTAKPRIASAQADGAVRAADPSPPSAAAGLGDELSQPIAELASSYLDIRAAPALGVSADPAGGQISFESGVDRPVVDASAPAPAIGPSTFEQFLPDNSQPDPATGRRDAATPPGGDSPADADVTDEKLPATPDGDSELGYIFDGAEAFGDDEILDFTIKIEGYSSSQDQGDASPIMADGDLDAVLSVSGFSEWGSFGLLEPDPVHTDFVTFSGEHSAADAIPPI